MSSKTDITREGNGRVMPIPSRPKRKRFAAFIKIGFRTRVLGFPTRRAAHDWLAQVQQNQVSS